QEHAVAARRLGEPVDLLFQGHDLSPRLLEGGDETLVVLGQPGELRLRCRQTLLQLTHVSRAFGQLAPDKGEFLLKERDLGGEIMCFLLPARGARLRVVATCHVPPPRGFVRGPRLRRNGSAALVSTLTAHGPAWP